MPKHFSIIDNKQYTTWILLDGQRMAGTFVFEGYDSYHVKTVTGSNVIVPKAKCRPATCDDVLEACRFRFN